MEDCGLDDMAQDGVRWADRMKPASHRFPYEAGNYMSESGSRLRVAREKSVVIGPAGPGTKNVLSKASSNLPETD